jgi:hypothetical protein
MKPQSSPTARRTSTGSASLEQFDGSRFAVMIPQIRREPFCGPARYEQDDLLGSILRIEIEAQVPGNPHILIAENECGGLITSDSRYGCDYCFLVLADD